MKKSVVIITVVFVLIALSCVCANAEEGEMIYDMSNVFDSLSDDIKQSLQNMGVDLGNFSKLANLSFENVMGEILSLALGNISSPLKGLVNITALLLLCSVISAYNGSLSCDISNSLNITATLCITCAAVVPAVGVIASTGSVICTASNIMLAYVPVMAVIMASSGSVAGSASYYAVMIGAGEGVSQLSSKIIVPLLNMFLGLSITSSVSPSVNLSGFMSMISKSVKWLLGFAMTIFTAVLTFRQLISVSVDNVSTRAVRFTLNSFIPIVGSALSDAYKVVQGSIGLLKSGIGIIVILSVTIVFMPMILQGVMWMFTLWIGKSTAEVLNLNGPAIVCLFNSHSRFAVHYVNLHSFNGGSNYAWRRFIMSGLFTVVVVMCASALICSLVQTFVTDGSTKKIISLVLGAFIICCMVVPVKNAVSSFNTNVEENQNSVKEISTDDEAYSNAVIKQTEINLETALKNLLLQNNIIIKSCDIILSRVENNGIIIASISIYIDKEFVRYTNLVSSIVYDNFGITPNIMTE